MVEQLVPCAKGLAQKYTFCRRLKEGYCSWGTKSENHEDKIKGVHRAAGKTLWMATENDYATNPKR